MVYALTAQFTNETKPREYIVSAHTYVGAVRAFQQHEGTTRLEQLLWLKVERLRDVPLLADDCRDPDGD